MRVQRSALKLAIGTQDSIREAKKNVCYSENYSLPIATRYRFGDNTKPHFITFSVVNWIDVFNRECYKQILVESLDSCINYKSHPLANYAQIILEYTNIRDRKKPPPLKKYLPINIF